MCILVDSCKQQEVLCLQYTFMFISLISLLRFRYESVTLIFILFFGSTANWWATTG